MEASIIVVMTMAIIIVVLLVVVVVLLRSNTTLREDNEKLEEAISTIHNSEKLPPLQTETSDMTGGFSVVYKSEAQQGYAHNASGMPYDEKMKQRYRQTGKATDDKGYFYEGEYLEYSYDGSHEDDLDNLVEANKEYYKSHYRKSEEEENAGKKKFGIKSKKEKNEKQAEKKEDKKADKKEVKELKEKQAAEITGEISAVEEGEKSAADGTKLSDEVADDEKAPRAFGANDIVDNLDSVSKDDDVHTPEAAEQSANDSVVEDDIVERKKSDVRAELMAMLHPELAEKDAQAEEEHNGMNEFFSVPTVEKK